MKNIISFSYYTTQFTYSKISEIIGALEKTQRLRYVDPQTGKTTIAAWKDLISTYKKESECLV